MWCNFEWVNEKHWLSDEPWAKHTIAESLSVDFPCIETCLEQKVTNHNCIISIDRPHKKFMIWFVSSCAMKISNVHFSSATNIYTTAANRRIVNLSFSLYRRKNKHNYFWHEILFSTPSFYLYIGVCLFFVFFSSLHVCSVLQWQVQNCLSLVYFSLIPLFLSFFLIFSSFSTSCFVLLALFSTRIHFSIPLSFLFY